MYCPLGEYGPNTVAGGPTVSAPIFARASTSPVLSTAVVPDAVTLEVAPVAPLPPKISQPQFPVCVAVIVVPCVALSVKVVVAGEVFTKVPVTVPEVNGVVSVVGDEILSVLVILALVGVVEYDAAKVGLTTDAPTGTVQPPVKLVIENAVASEIVIVLPLLTQVSPLAHARVNAGPVSELIEVIAATFTVSEPPSATAPPPVAAPLVAIVTELLASAVFGIALAETANDGDVVEFVTTGTNHEGQDADGAAKSVTVPDAVYPPA